MKGFILSVMAFLLVPTGGWAQESKPNDVVSKFGMVMLEEGGELQAPSLDVAILMLEQGRRNDITVVGNPGDAATAVLRQAFEQRSSTELDAFVDRLLDIIRTTDDFGVELRAVGAIKTAALSHDRPGTPYAGAADAFVRLYESYRDPVGKKAKGALFDAYSVGAIDYIRRLHEASEPPPSCVLMGGRVLPGQEPPENPCPNAPTMWCNTGQILLHGLRPDGLRGDEEAPDPERYSRLCEWGVTIHN